MPTINRTLRPVSTLVIVLALYIGLRSGEMQLQSQPSAPATVTLRVVDSYGRTLNYKIERFHAKDQPNVDLANQFEGLTFKHAVQGKMYDFRLVPIPEQIEYPAFTQSIAVGEPQTLAVFSIPKAILLPDRATPWPVTKVVIKPAPHGEDVWVNTRPAFAPDISGTDTSETAAVGMDGTFNLHGTHGGVYIVTIYQGSMILKLAVVDIPQFAPSHPIEVKLD